MSTALRPETIIGPDKGCLDPDHPRLNIGGGSFPIPGYLTVDRMFGDEAYPLAFEDGSMEEVYASHTLEHFGWAEYSDVLDEWIRVLKPGGVLRIAVPDVTLVMQMQGQPGVPPVGAVLMGGQTDANDFHKSSWSEGDLRRVLKDKGLVGIRPFRPFHEDCSMYPFSANVEATKPTEAMKMAPYQQVAFVMSVPRLGFNIHFERVMEAVFKYNAACHMEGGAYFDLSMEKGIQKALKGGTPYIITIDYDSVIGDDDIWRLVTLMESNPEYDALAAVQLRRGEHRVLVSGNKEASAFGLMDFAGEIMPCRTACFGLTIFRRECFDKMPYPWLRHRDEYHEDGTHARTVEADMVFWENMERAGLKLGMATGVCIGHLEEFVSWPGREYQPVLQEESDFHARGRHPEAHP